MSTLWLHGGRGWRAAHVALWILLVFPSVARGADAGRNPALAQALFEEAQRLVKAGDYEQACLKFKGSYDADPGGGTLLNLADCYERQNKLALAWSTFKEARVMAQRDGRMERVEFAERHLQSLEARLPRFTVRVASPRAASLTITLDGEPIQEAAWGMELPIDPGAHTLRATAEGKEPFETVVNIPDGAQVTLVEVPMLADGSEPTVEADASVPNASDASSSSAALGESGNSKRIAGWVIGGVGVVGIGVGSYFGVRAITRWKDRTDQCPAEQKQCSPDAKAAYDDAKTAGTISTVAFAAGLAAAGVGAFLVLTSGGDNETTAKSTRVVPLVGRRSLGLEITRSW